jgi:hypothetical protein
VITSGVPITAVTPAATAIATRILMARNMELGKSSNVRAEAGRAKSVRCETET